MQKVIGINLNGNAYQLDEAGYDVLLAYLDGARAQLHDNPDQAEILADLEQAIAEKCNRVLSAHKTVVTGAEVDQIVKEMGPVDGGAAEGATPGAARASESRPGAQGGASAPKRLFQIREGAMISGVCNGLAAYFNIDVTIVRIIFVILAVLTKGVWILVYGVLMFVIPYANTSEERAAAQGLPFNAQELVDQAKRNYANFKSGKGWNWNWKRQTHRAGRDRSVPPTAGSAPQVLAEIMAPVLGIINAAAFVLLAFAFYSLGTRGAVFGWPLPEGVPLWLWLLILVAVYQVATTPLAFARHAAYLEYGRHRHGWFAVWGGVLWVGFAIAFLWLGNRYIPGVHDFLQTLPATLTNLSRRFQA